MSDQAPQSNQLIEKIRAALDELVTLKITTAVGPVTLSGADQKTMLKFDNAKAMYTEINLLQGDIKTMYDEEFVTGAYQPLQAFHQQREQEGQKIIHTNLQALYALLQLAQGKDPGKLDA